MVPNLEIRGFQHLPRALCRGEPNRRINSVAGIINLFEEPELHVDLRHDRSNRSMITPGSLFRGY